MMKKLEPNPHPYFSKLLHPDTIKNLTDPKNPKKLEPNPDPYFSKLLDPDSFINLTDPKHC